MEMIDIIFYCLQSTHFDVLCRYGSITGQLIQYSRNSNSSITDTVD